MECGHVLELGSWSYIDSELECVFVADLNWIDHRKYNVRKNYFFSFLDPILTALNPTDFSDFRS